MIMSHGLNDLYLFLIANSDFWPCKYLFGTFPGRQACRKKISVSCLTRSFLAARFFFFFFILFFQIFFSCKVSICGIEHTVNVDSYSINISSRSRVEWDVFSSWAHLRLNIRPFRFPLFSPESIANVLYKWHFVYIPVTLNERLTETS